MAFDTTETKDPLAELDAQARESFDEGDHQAAKQVWEAILQMDPEHAGALAGLGRLAEDGSAPAEAPAAADSSPGEGARPSASGTDQPAPDPDAFNPVLLAGLARAREKLEAGETESAAAILDELEVDNPGHPDIVDLRGRCSSAPGDAGKSDGFDLDLDLDPLPGPASSAAPETEPPAGSLDLEMDLSSPSAPSPASPSREDEDSRELMDAVGELGAERPVDGLRLGEDEGAGGEPGAAQSGAGDSEAAALVGEARQALESGDTQSAMQIASRAMALDENAQGAAAVLEDARALEATRNEEAERHLTEGISEFEQGRIAEAIPHLQKVLALVPGHAEAEAFLSQAREQIPDSPSGPLEFDGSELEGLDSVPLGQRAGDGEASTGPVFGDVEGVTTGPAGAQPASPSEPPPPVDIPLPGPGPQAGSPVDVALPPPPPTPPRLAAEPPSTPVAPAAPAPPAAPSRRRASRGGGPSRLLLLALLLVVVLGAGGWYAVTQLGLLEGSSAQDLIREPPARARAAPGATRPAGSQPPPPRREQAPRSSEQATASPPRPAPGEPRYTRADVPRLLARADQALAAGNPHDAVELLVAAQSADPVNFDIIEKLEAARSELHAAEEAATRLEAGRVAFRQGQYDEALRIFYRIPAGHRPARLDTWIALGWYNLGVRSLQSGNTHEALQFFNDSLDHAPSDPLTLRNREVAIRYSGRKRDEAYRIYVNSLKTRKLPD